MKREVVVKLWEMCLNNELVQLSSFFQLFYSILFICALFHRATETHALAAANQQKNDRLRAAFGISNDYVDGSSFHTDRKEKEKEKRDQERLEREKMQQQKYM